MAKNFDDNLGRLMDFLDRSGLSENTILVVTSDHGEMFGSHGRRNKMVPYREAVNIPCIVRWPGRISGRDADGCPAHADGPFPDAVRPGRPRGAGHVRRYGPQWRPVGDEELSIATRC